MFRVVGGHQPSCGSPDRCPVLALGRRAGRPVSRALGECWRPWRSPAGRRRLGLGGPSFAGPSALFKGDRIEKMREMIPRRADRGPQEGPVRAPAVPAVGLLYPVAPSAWL